MKRTFFVALAACAALATTTISLARNSYRAPRLHTYTPKTYKAPKLGPVYHRGYVNKSGRYVLPHMQTAPNRTRVDNWTSRPNVNPYNGKVGTKDPYAAPERGH